MRRNNLLGFAIVILVLAAMAAKSLLVSVPPVRTHNQAGGFDAARAKARLEFILGDQRPHPADSPADEAVRARLIASLQQIGLKPLVRDQFACNDFQKARLVACARVRNVIAVLGPSTGKAVLLSAHYDSVPVGPGAGDDGAGVATLLEVGSILKDRPLKRPVILLFNEGEELGLIGARAFLADPLSRNVDSMLNFEARGVTGPVTMFETNQPNGAAIAVFANSVGRPIASSLSTDIARLIPNDTDVTVYKERGWLTLNFAMVGNETRYHSPGDDLAALDLRTLQHMGDQALAVASTLSAGAPQAKSDRIFTDVLGRAFIQMPLSLGVGFFVVLLVLFAGIAWKRGAVARAQAIVIGGFLLAIGLSWLAVSIMGALRGGTYWRAHPEFAFVAIYATVLLAELTVLRMFGASVQTTKLRAAYWLIFLLLGGLLALAAPGAIIYFLIPPSVVLIGIAIARWYRPAETIGGLVALLLLYLSWGEMLAQLEEIFSPGPLWVVAPVAAPMIMPALIEAHRLFAGMSRRLVLSGTGIIALIAWTVAGVAPAYSLNREQRFTIEHLTEFPSGKSFWSILNDGAPLPPTYSSLGHWHRGKLPFSERKRWLAPAPAVPGLAAPSIHPLEILRSGTERRIRMRIRSNGAERIALIAPPEAHLQSAGVGGFIRTLVSADSSGKFTVSCTGRSCDGAELTIDLNSARPVVITVVGARNGLPASAGPLLRARPELARPQYVPDETVAITRIKV